MKKLFTSCLRVCLLAAPLCLAAAAPVDAKSVGKDQVNVRSKPNLKSDIVFTAPLGYPIKIEKTSGKWSYFRDWQDNRGWIYNPLISDIKTVVISAENVNVRSSGSTKSKVVGTAQIGEIYKILATRNNWVQLGYYHDSSVFGWVRSDLVFGD
ncbi:MAG: SH3 domain-containing protein [Desulfobulbus sp.]|jgi:uncharacterized protein YgiM (DUF1202 family)